MSGDKPPIRVPLDDVLVTLLKQRGIDKGLWRLAIGMRFAATTLEWEEQTSSEKDVIPTALVGIADLALVEGDRPGPHIIDASTMKLSSLPVPDTAPSTGPAKRGRQPASKRAKKVSD